MARQRGIRASVPLRVWPSVSDWRHLGVHASLGPARLGHCGDWEGRDWAAALAQASLPTLPGDLPPLVLSPSQYHNYTQPRGNFIPYANEERQEYR